MSRMAFGAMQTSRPFFRRRFLGVPFISRVSSPPACFSEVVNNKKVVNVVDAKGSPLIGHREGRRKDNQIFLLQRTQAFWKKLHDVSHCQSRSVEFASASSWGSEKIEVVVLAFRHWRQNAKTPERLRLWFGICQLQVESSQL